MKIISTLLKKLSAPFHSGNSFSFLNNSLHTEPVESLCPELASPALAVVEGPKKIVEGHKNKIHKVTDNLVAFAGGQAEFLLKTKSKSAINSRLTTKHSSFITHNSSSTLKPSFMKTLPGLSIFMPQTISAQKSISAKQGLCAVPLHMERLGEVASKNSFMKSFLSKSTFLATIFFVAGVFFVNTAKGQAALTSDSADYQPGSTATLTGTGFLPGETVKMQVLHADYQPGDPIGADHEPWDVVADGSGNFTTTWHVCEDDCRGQLLRATAVGQSSNLNAEVLFYDATILITANTNWNAITTGTGPGGLPSSIDVIVIKNGRTLTVNVSDAVCASIQIGSDVNPDKGNGTLAFNSGSQVTVSGNLTLGDAGQIGTITMTSGGTLISNGITFVAGTNNNTINQGSTSTITVNGTATINQPDNNNTTNQWNVNSGLATVSGLITFAGTNTTATKIARIVITTGTLNANGGITFAGTTAATKVIDLTGGAANLNIGGAFTFTNGTLLPGTTSTVNFNGTSAQTIPIGVSSVNYNNLTINNTHSSGATLGSNNISATRVTGDVSVQTGTLSNGGFGITMASAKNFSVSNGATFKLTGTSGMAVVSGGGTKTFGATSTVDYAGTGPQTISSETYGHLKVSGTASIGGIDITVVGTTTVSGTLSFTNNLNTKTFGNIAVNTGGTWDASGSSNENFSVSGDFDNDGTFTSGGGTYTFDGAVTKVLGGDNSPTFTGLAIAKTGGAGITLSNDITVSGTLTLTSGIIDAATNNKVVIVTNSATGAVSGGSISSFVKGALRRSLSTGSYNYPVGKGTTYLPFNFNLSSAASPVITVEAFDGNSGGSADGTSLASISSTEHWSATLNSGTFTGKVSLTRQAALTTENAIGKSSSANGTYTSIGGTASSPSINSSNDISSLSYFVMATAAACPTGIATPTPSSQTVCNNASIAELSTTGQTGGTGSGFTYKWYNNGSTNSNSGGVEVGTGLTYTPPATTTAGDTYYYVVVSRGSCTDIASTPVSVTVRPAFTSGAINTTGETICYGGTPGVIGNTTVASGGDGSITYSWRSSADGYTAAIVGATSSTYTPPAGLTSTTSYRRYANDGTCNTTPTVSTGTWTVTVYALFTSGAIASTGETICHRSPLP